MHKAHVHCQKCRHLYNNYINRFIIMRYITQRRHQFLTDVLRLAVVVGLCRLQVVASPLVRCHFSREVIQSKRHHACLSSTYRVNNANKAPLNCLSFPFGRGAECVKRSLINATRNFVDVGWLKVAQRWRNFSWDGRSAVGGRWMCLPPTRARARVRTCACAHVRVFVYVNMLSVWPPNMFVYHY